MKEALKLALEALEMHVPHVYKDRGYGPITAIKEALAQPEQEPVAFSCLRCVTPKKCAVHGCSPNTWPSEFSPKRPWVGLTDEQREACTQSPFTEDNYDDIEAKLKELNT